MGARHIAASFPLVLNAAVWTGFQYIHICIDVKERSLSQSKLCFAGPEELFLDTASTPDLYGPIWITLTIVFLLTAVAQFNDHSDNDISPQEVEAMSLHISLCLCATVVTVMATWQSVHVSFSGRNTGICCIIAKRVSSHSSCCILWDCQVS